ncbi:MAG: sulfur carrier protein ThiS [Sphingobacterium sp.]|uniref:sulfur carrier protein ThiS n=1 Tax=Sphingobacterium sp. JB170 TaxID=1434842 RepID=UPI00097F694B|nr:sulfur carrier protein ThiS [Sphingobacterium sp. JB170]SJN49482.1 hypothetical protein FM107_18790 [Sphingobacterium sp. JB170]
MYIKLNSKIYELEAPFPENLEQMLVRLVPNMKPTGIAVALNNTVVPRELWTKTPVATQSEITLITATQGG